MIEKTLEKLGFGEKETVLYLEILRRGKVTPAALAKITGINRATVYAVAKDLLEKGVITEDLAQRSLYYVALPTEELQTLIEKQEEQTKKTRKLVYNAIDELARIPLNTQYFIPKIRFVEDENVRDHLYRQFHTWFSESQKYDATWWGFQDETFVEHFTDWVEWVWQEKPTGHTMKVFGNTSPTEEQLKAKTPPHRILKMWTGVSDFTATTWIIGEYIVMIYTRERPFYLIEIHNPVLAENMRKIFKGIWNGTESL